MMRYHGVLRMITTLHVRGEAQICSEIELSVEAPVYNDENDGMLRNTNHVLHVSVQSAYRLMYAHIL